VFFHGNLLGEHLAGTPNAGFLGTPARLIANGLTEVFRVGIFSFFEAEPGSRGAGTPAVFRRWGHCRRNRPKRGWKMPGFSIRFFPVPGRGETRGDVGTFGGTAWGRRGGLDQPGGFDEVESAGGIRLGRRRGWGRRSNWEELVSGVHLALPPNRRRLRRSWWEKMFAFLARSPWGLGIFWRGSDVECVV